ncbi:MAG: class I SAM-dependent methyltransferase [Gammaproteobacteria bacterium]|nr:class I SAM-dependent methyltransferase [Gammaproteobacteria bacterium]
MRKKNRNSEKISPTAYATGYFWYRHGLSHPALVTAKGRRLGRAFGVLTAGMRLLGGVSMDALMLARHRGIDALLARAIESGQVQQVIEIAAGLSPRGWDFMRRYGRTLTYIETDLPAMAATKRQLLADAGLLGKGHRVLDLDALADSGPNSLAQVARTLDPAKGTAIVTEGLMNYLDPATARGVWRRIAASLSGFAHGVYLSDLYLRPEQREAATIAFGVILSTFVRGRLHVHFHTADEAIAQMRDSGFAAAQVHSASELPETHDLAATRGADRVRILEART